MVIHRALDEVLRSWSHVAVLRALLDTTTGFSGNEVARLAGMHPLSALKALSSLEVLGIVRRQRGGRDHIFTLNHSHFIVREGLIGLYEAERKLSTAINSTLASTLRRRMLSAVIFGSVARHEEAPASDLDLCCVVRAQADKEKVREALNSQSIVLHETFGVKLAPVLLTVAELRKRAKSTLVKDMLAHGKLVTGKPLKSLFK